MKKGQTALEYLMTYGWAILIVIVVVAALYSLGLTKPCRWVGTQVSGFGETPVSGIKFDTTPQLTLSLQRQKPGDINITGVSFTSTANGNGALTVSPPTTLRSGATATQFIVSGGAGVAGDCYSIDVTVNYTEIDTGTTHQSVGRISGTIESP